MHVCTYTNTCTHTNIYREIQLIKKESKAMINMGLRMMDLLSWAVQERLRGVLDGVIYSPDLGFHPIFWVNTLFSPK